MIGGIKIPYDLYLAFARLLDTMPAILEDARKTYTRDHRDTEREAAASHALTVARLLHTEFLAVNGIKEVMR